MSNKNLFNENGELVVTLDYTPSLKEVRLSEPKSYHTKRIQRAAKEAAKELGELDQTTLVQITVISLADGQDLTIEQLDGIDASDMFKLGASLAEFRFFRELAEQHLGSLI